MAKSKYDVGMATVKVPVDVHNMLKLIKSRYKMDIGDSLREFIAQVDPELAQAAQRLTELQAEQERIMRSVLGESADDE